MFKQTAESAADDDGPDGMLAYAQAIAHPNRNDPTWPLPSFNAQDWAEAFCRITAKDGVPIIGEDIMVAWFANALMRGFDEHAMRTSRASVDAADAGLESLRALQRPLLTQLLSTQR